MNNVTCKNCGAAIELASSGAVSCQYCQTQYAAPDYSPNTNTGNSNVKITRTTKTVTTKTNGGPVTTTVTTTSDGGDMPDMDKLSADMNKMAADMREQFGQGDFAARHEAFHKQATAKRAATAAPATQMSSNLKGILLCIALSFVGFGLVVVGGINMYSWLMVFGVFVMMGSGLGFIAFILKAIFGGRR